MEHERARFFLQSFLWIVELKRSGRKNCGRAQGEKHGEDGPARGNQGHFAHGRAEIGEDGRHQPEYDCCRLHVGSVKLVYVLQETRCHSLASIKWTPFRISCIFGEPAGSIVGITFWTRNVEYCNSIKAVPVAELFRGGPS